MANQHLVRALVRSDDAPRLRRELIDELEIRPEAIAISQPEPATYRDESPDLRLHELVQAGKHRAIVGGIVGGLLALAIVLLLPPLRDWLPFSLILVLGGIWGGSIAMTARGMQVNKRESDLGEEMHDVRADEAADLRLVTVEVERDRNPVVDLLAGRGATLLDSQHPQVGRGPSARPARPGEDGVGGTAPRD